MADIPLYNGTEDFSPRPRADMRFTGAAARPYPDGRRVKLNFRITPFEFRPSVDIAVLNAAGQEVASLSLIEAMETEFDLTIHLRGPEPRGPHSVHLVMFYPQDDQAPLENRQVVAEEHLTFEVQPPA